MLAAPRDERLNALAELVKWGNVEAEANERRERGVARKARERMDEIVSVLGFDPLEYEPERDAVAVIISKRARQMLAAIPGTTAHVAKAAGVPSADVRAYLWHFVLRGDITCEKKGQTLWWAVAE